MFRKVLVALDSSASSNLIFQEALSLAEVAGATMMLLHVLSPEEDGSPGISRLSGVEYYPGLSSEMIVTYRKQWEEFEAKCLAKLRSQVEKAMAQGVQAEFTQTPGSSGRTICDLAHTWDADLIVMGSRGRSGFTELILGSISSYVMHHAPCSVLVVHPQHHAQSEPKLLENMQPSV